MKYSISYSTSVHIAMLGIDKMLLIIHARLVAFMWLCMPPNIYISY